jgi:hypothetical protein
MLRVWPGSRSQLTRSVNQVPDIFYYRYLFFRQLGRVPRRAPGSDHRNAPAPAVGLKARPGRRGVRPRRIRLSLSQPEHYCHYDQHQDHQINP